MSLTAAASSGDLGSMEIFVEHGADVDERSRGFVSPLQAAARSGQTDSVRWLLERGADPNRIGTFGPLGSALDSGDPEMVKLLLAAGARVDLLSPPELQQVAVSASFALVRALAEAGISASGRRRMAEKAEISGRPQIAAYLRGDPVDVAEASKTDKAPAGRRTAVDLDAGSRGAEAEALIEEALDIIRRGDLDPELDRLGHHGESLLTGCIREGLTTLALALLERGADPDAGHSESDSRALIQAVDNGEWQVFDALLAQSRKPVACASSPRISST